MVRRPKRPARVHHVAVGVGQRPTSLPKIATDAVFVAVLDSEEVADLLQAEFFDDDLAVQVVLVGASFVQGLAQTLHGPRRFAAVVVQDQGQGVGVGRAFVRREFHGRGVVEGVVVGDAVGRNHIHLHGVGSALRKEGGEGHDVGFVLLQGSGPRLLLGRAAVDAVFEHATRQRVGAGVGDRHFNGHVLHTAKHALRRAGDVDAGVVFKADGPVREAVPNFRAGSCRVQILGQSQSPAYVESAVPIRLPVVHASRARRGPAVQLTDDAVVLVEQRGARRPSFSHAKLPFVDVPNRGAPSLLLRRTVVFEADFFHVAGGVVDADRACGDCPGRVPTCVLHVEGGRRSLAQFNQGHVGLAAVDQQGAAADALVGGAGVAGAGRGFVVEVVDPVSRVAQTVVRRQKVGRAVVQGVVDQGARTNREAALHDQRHAALFRGPRGAFRAVHVDVAIAAVPKRTAFAVVRPPAQRTVSLNHLADFKGRKGGEGERLAVLHHELVGRHNAGGESAPRFDVAVVEGAKHVLPVGRMQEQHASLRHVVRAKLNGKSRGTGRGNRHAPHPPRTLHRPRPVRHGRPGHVVFHPKTPRRLLEAVGHKIFLRQRLPVQGRKHFGCGPNA